MKPKTWPGNCLLAVAACCWLAPQSQAQTVVDMRAAAEAAMPATVGIKVSTEGTAQGRWFANQGRWQAFVHPPRGPVDNWIASQKQPGERAMRSGFAVGNDLLITANVPRSDEEVEVLIGGRNTIQGKVVIRDQVTGLAAIRVDSNEPLAGLALSDEAPSPGMPVAITWMQNGKDPSIDAAMISSGPVASSPARGFSYHLDTDVNDRGVGSPIVNAEGELVGVVTLSDVGDLTALPSLHVERLVLAANRENASDLQRGRLGVQLADADGSPVATQVMDGSPAAEAGLESGDEVLRVGEHPTKSNADVLAAVAMARAGDVVEVEVRRGDKAIIHTITLVKIPAEEVAPTAGPADVFEQIQRHTFKLQDGKLVPLEEDNEEVADTLKRWQEFVVPFGDRTGALRQFRVERSDLETALKEMEEKRAIHEEKIKALTQELRSMQSTEIDAKAIQKDLESMRKMMENLSRRLGDQIEKK